ncbi:amidase [Acuticoccus sediminis]|uniref:amidase n=1 Tax=Acuticoccus sediminis TaxID=2184697 RepID=UPI001CFEFADB|nr:amidase [Acuticoccus sediminis]
MSIADPTAPPAQGVFPPTATEAARDIAAGRLSPTELVAMCLKRIDEVDGRLHTYITLDAEGALAAAAEAEAEIAAGRYRGPLHGIPFAVKDNYDAAGLPTTGGSRMLEGNVPEVDSTPVARMKAAGAVLMGKLGTWEYGTGNGGEYFDLPIETTRNPWDTARFAGGSSTGAGSAVAAGTTVLALGSDTTGSVRLPASACGVVGVRATHGLVPRAGLIANCYSMDVPGPFTWTVADAALVLEAVTGHDPRDVSSAAVPPFVRPPAMGGSVAGLRIGVIRDVGPGFVPDPEMTAAFEAGLGVLKDLGADLRETAFPVPVPDQFAVASIIGPAESAAIHEDELTHKSAMMGYGLRDKLLKGAMIRAADYIAAQRQRRAIADGIEAMMSSFDAIVTYGACHVAPRIDDQAEMIAFTAETALTPFSLSSHPTLVQCTGFTAAGLPLHWQIAGPYFGEATILSIAAAFEAATPYRQRRPNL